MRQTKTLHLRILLCLSILLGVGSLYAQEAWDLQRLQDSAIANYPLIQQYDLINQSKEFNISNANKAYLPQFNITVIGGVINGLPSFTPGESNATNLNLITVAQFNQVIWDGGMIKANKGVLEAQANIETAQLDVSVYEIRQKINDLFFGILLIQEQIKQVHLLQKNLETNKKRVQAGLENGVVYVSDLDELEVELLNTEQKLTELNHAKQGYLSMLSVMAGVQLDENSLLQKPQPPLALEAKELNRPELVLFQNQRSLLDHQTAIQKSMLYPKVGLMGFATFIEPGVDFGPSSINNIFVGGLSLSWNISGLYRNGNNKRISALNFEKIRVQEETFRYGVSLETKQAAQEVDKYQALLQRDEKLITLKQNIKNSYQTKYDNGVCTMSDLLLRINDENVAVQNKILHETQFMNAWYRYKTLVGQ